MNKPTNTETSGPPPHTGPTPVERLAQMVSSKANAAIVYGERVERDGVTVIPVAKVRYGFGGGFAHKAHGTDGGGGGGVQATPIGYIELKNGAAEFRPIRDPSAVARVVVFGGLFGLMLIRSVLRRRRVADR